MSNKLQMMCDGGNDNPIKALKLYLHCGSLK